MKLGIVGDTHLGCSDYSTKRRSDFAAAFRNAIDACLRRGAEVVCLLGDVFDSHAMRRSVDAFADVMTDVAPVLARLRADDIPVFAIAGNHEFGRGREAGELRILESLGFLRVLRCEEVVVGGVGICGIPWQPPESIPGLRDLAKELARRSTTRRRVLLLHNYVRGSRRIPSMLWEIDPSVAEGYDRVFVGHHHDREELERFVIPGATEFQNVLETERLKHVVIYDVRRERTKFVPLPRTRDFIAIELDATAHRDRDAVLEALEAELDRRKLSRDAFVLVRIVGTMRGGQSVTRRDIAAVLRERDVFDRYVEIRATTQTATARTVTRGSSIDHALRRTFGKNSDKARRYLDTCVQDDFPAKLVERILR